MTEAEHAANTSTAAKIEPVRACFHKHVPTLDQLHSGSDLAQPEQLFDMPVVETDTTVRRLFANLARIEG